MAIKNVRDIDEKVWLEFGGFCKSKGKKMGEELTKILKDFLKNNGGGRI